MPELPLIPNRLVRRFACGGMRYAPNHCQTFSVQREPLSIALQCAEPLWFLLRANRRFIIPPSSAQPLSRAVALRKSLNIDVPRLFRSFTFCGGFLGFYGYLKRATQHVVVSDCVFSDEYQHLAPCCVLRGKFVRP